MPRLPDPAEHRDDMLLEAFRYRDALVAYAYAITRNWAIAEDVVHDAYRVVNRRWQDFDAGADLFRWVRGIVRNTAFKAVRSREKENPRPTTEMDLLLQESIDQVWQEEVTDELARRIAALRECLSELNDGARSLLSDFYVRGDSCKEIAARRKQNPDYPRAYLYRVRQRLRECMGERMGSSDRIPDDVAISSGGDLFFEDSVGVAPGSLARSGKAGQDQAWGEIVREALLFESALATSVRQHAMVGEDTPQVAPEIGAPPATDPRAAWSPPEDVQKKIAKLRSRSRWRGVAKLAAALVVGAAGWLTWETYLAPEPTPPLAYLNVVRGVADLTTAAGEEAVSSGVRAPLDSGEAVSVPAGGLAELVFAAGGISVMVESETSIQIEEGSGDGVSVRLTQGIVEADVESLPEEEPFAVATPHGTVRVLGTQFRVGVVSGRSVVSMIEGSAAFESDRVSTLVAGEVAIAEPDGLKMVGPRSSDFDMRGALEREESIRGWAWDFEDGGRDRSGAFVWGSDILREPGKAGNGLTVNDRSVVRLEGFVLPEAARIEFWAWVDREISGETDRENVLFTNHTEGQVIDGIRIAVSNTGAPEGETVSLVSGDGNLASRIEMEPRKVVFPRGRWNHVSVRYNRPSGRGWISINGEAPATWKDSLCPTFKREGPLHIGLPSKPTIARHKRLSRFRIDELRITPVL